jgi:hypothetical protein
VCAVATNNRRGANRTASRYRAPDADSVGPRQATRIDGSVGRECPAVRAHGERRMLATRHFEWSRTRPAVPPNWCPHVQVLGWLQAQLHAVLCALRWRRHRHSVLSVCARSATGRPCQRRPPSVVARRARSADSGRAMVDHRTAYSSTRHVSTSNGRSSFWPARGVPIPGGSQRVAFLKVDRTQRPRQLWDPAVGVGEERFSSVGRVSLAEPPSGLTEVCDVRCASGSGRVGQACRRSKSRCAHSARGVPRVPGDAGPTARARSGVTESRWFGRARQCRRLIGDALRARPLVPVRLPGSPGRAVRARRDRCRSFGWPPRCHRRLQRDGGGRRRAPRHR